MSILATSDVSSRDFVGDVSIFCVLPTDPSEPALRRETESGSHAPTTSQCTTFRMLAEIARRKSRSSKFETRVFIMSKNSFRRSFSCSSSACRPRDSCEYRIWRLWRARFLFNNLQKPEPSHQLPWVAESRNVALLTCRRSRQMSDSA